MDTSKKPHLCEECGKSFSIFSLLTVHKRTHTGEKPYSCLDCGKTFRLLSTLKYHKSTHLDKSGEKSLKNVSRNVNKGVYLCEECGKGFATRSALNTHKRMHTGKKPHECLKCGKAFFQASNLRRHYKVHIEEKLKPEKIKLNDKQDQPKDQRIECEYCSKKFNKKRRLIEHLETHGLNVTDGKIDNINSLINENDKEVQNHLMDYFHGLQKQKFLKCNTCEILFEDLDELKKHQKLHINEMPYKCELCEIGFYNSSVFAKHKEKKHPDKRSSYVCDVCDKVFLFKHKLTKHMRIHTRPHKCAICSRAFTYAHKLIVHERIHREERPYKCEVCQKGFYESCRLMVHKLENVDQKLKECELCSKTFKCRSELQQHKTAHLGEKPYKCELCPKVYKLSKYLEEHKLTHKEEELAKKPHKCDLCQYSFEQSSSLQNHRKNHFVKKLHKCTDCEKPVCVTVDLKGKTSITEKRYICLKCEKKSAKSKKNTTFKTSKMPQDIRLIVCDYCKKEFKLKMSLIQHLKTHETQENIDSINQEIKLEFQEILPIKLENTETEIPEKLPGSVLIDNLKVEETEIMDEIILY